MNLASSSEPKPRLRERLRSATRDAILAAAADVFAADGAANARIEDIAARAGVAVGTVYNYFEDRAALVAALLDVRTKSLLEALDEDSGRSRSKGGRGPSAAFAGELDRFVATLAGHFDTNRGLLTVLLDEHLA